MRILKAFVAILAVLAWSSTSIAQTQDRDKPKSGCCASMDHAAHDTGHACCAADKPMDGCCKDAEACTSGHCADMDCCKTTDGKTDCCATKNASDEKPAGKGGCCGPKGEKTPK